MRVSVYCKGTCMESSKKGTRKKIHYGLLGGSGKNMSLKPEEQSILEVLKKVHIFLFQVTMLVSIRSQTNIKSMLQIQQFVDLYKNNKSNRKMGYQKKIHFLIILLPLLEKYPKETERGKPKKEAAKMGKILTLEKKPSKMENHFSQQI